MKGRFKSQQWPKIRRRQHSSETSDFWLISAWSTAKGSGILSKAKLKRRRSPSWSASNARMRALAVCRCHWRFVSMPPKRGIFCLRMASAFTTLPA